MIIKEQVLIIKTHKEQGCERACGPIILNVLFYLGLLVHFVYKTLLF